MTLDGKGLGHTLLPAYFYDLNAITDEGQPRWVDEFADYAEHIIQPDKDYNPVYMKQRMDRNIAYSKWLAGFFHRDPVSGAYMQHLKPGMLKWQAIRILSCKDPISDSTQMWWNPYQDAQFRVFINPQTMYDQHTGEHVQYYLLSPEDCYLVNRQEIISAKGTPPTRDYNGRERFFSADRNLRRARLVAVDNCTHLRNEGDEHRLIL